MMLARFISSKGVDIRNIRDLSIAVGIVALPSLLIVLQPDQGTTTVFMVMLLGVLFWSGFNKYFLFSLVSFPIAILMSLKGLPYFILTVTLILAISLLMRPKFYAILIL